MTDESNLIKSDLNYFIVGQPLSDVQLAFYNDEKLAYFDGFIQEIQGKYGIDFYQAMQFLQQREHDKQGILIPLSIFSESRLGIIEATVKFLHEEKNMRFRDIGLLLRRNNKSVWISYHSASKKMRMRFTPKPSLGSFPAKILRDEKLAALECLVVYLKEERKMQNRSIAELLGRTTATVWESYRRAREKLR